MNQIQVAETLTQKAEDLLKSIFSKRVELAEAISILEGISVPDKYSKEWFVALRQATKLNFPPLEYWALQKIKQQCGPDLPLLLKQKKYLEEIGNHVELLTLEIEILEYAFRNSDLNEGFNSLGSFCVKAVESNYRASAIPKSEHLIWILKSLLLENRYSDYLFIKKVLRLWYAIQYDFPKFSEATNLIFLSFDLETSDSLPIERKVESFVELITQNQLPEFERLSVSADLRFLFLVNAKKFLVQGSIAQEIMLSEDEFLLGCLVANLSYSNTQSEKYRMFFVEMRELLSHIPESHQDRSLINHLEKSALENFSSFVPIMTKVFGLNAFSHSEFLVVTNEILNGSKKFFETGINSEPGYGKLVQSFCMTNGLTNHFLSFLLRLYNPPYRLKSCDGIVGYHTESQMNEIAQILARDGLYQFPKKIPQHLLEQLIQYAETETCYQHHEDGVSKEPSQFSENQKPHAMKYNFLERELVQKPFIQRIMTDEVLFGVSQAYLGSKPIFDAVAMWWSTNFAKQASSEAAQLFHFDMERIKWLKWFIYLTDVTTDTGPHCFVKGSHKLGNKPPSLLQRGYQRVSDAEMASHYPSENIIEIVGEKGTVFVEDTIGFHKGKHPRTAPRLVLELEFSNCLYGALTPRDCAIPNTHFPQLKKMGERFPQLFCKYIVIN